MKQSRAAGFVPVSLILSILFGVLLVLVSGLTVWAFINYQDQKNNVDSKISAAVQDAKAAQQKDDQAAFAEQEKLPTRKLTGPEDLGGVSLDYPKTWSVYIANSGQNNQYQAYLFPGAVPSLQSNTPYALRVDVINASYDNTVATYQQYVKDGTITTSPVQLNGVNGLRLDGKFSETAQGSAVLFKVRDKTLRVMTESTTYQSDFDKIILPSLKFNK